MSRRKPSHGRHATSESTDVSAQRVLAATGILLGCVLAFIVFMRYRPYKELPPTKTDLYSNYRWGNCDGHPEQCSREYSSSDHVSMPRHRNCLTQDCPCSEERAGVNMIYTFTNFNQRCQYRRYVGLGNNKAEYVYSRVALEYDELVKAGIDPVQLENVVTSLAQMSSGNIGELLALKRPDLEERHWEEMKAFVQQNPKGSSPKKPQDLFKRWWSKDPNVLPSKARPPNLPVLGDFKVRPGPLFHMSSTSYLYRIHQLKQVRTRLCK